MNFQEKKRAWIAEALTDKGAAGSSTWSPETRRRRSMGTWNEENISILEENDDEMERQVWRQSTVFQSPGNQSTPPSSPVITGIDLNTELAKCVKLNAAHKINTKNAFQLKIIDYLLSSFKKNNSDLSNFQMVGVGLEISTVIYGYRVDKVHADLLKTLTGYSDWEDDQNQLIESSDELDTSERVQQKKQSRRTNRRKFLTSAEKLKGIVETCDSSSFRNCEQLEVLTSDLLIQATFSQYSTDGVYLDHLSEADSNVANRIFQIPCVEDFSKDLLCPTFSNFKFLNQDISEYQEDQDIGEYKFDLDATVQELHHSPTATHDMMDDLEIFEERCERQAQSCRIRRITDFHDIIVNNMDPDVSYEYGYHPKNCRITLTRPFFWKVKMGFNHENELKKISKVTRNAKKISFNYEEIDKQAYKNRFSETKRKTKLAVETIQEWPTDKLTRHNVVLFSSENFDTFFCTSREFFARVQVHLEELEQFFESRLSGANEYYTFEEQLRNSPDLDQEGAGPQSYFENQEAFIGDNLVSAPTLIVPESSINYKKHAKKINMKQLKKIMWRELRVPIPNSSPNGEFDIKNFTDLYVAAASKLPEEDAENLSPGIAFITLLSLASEKDLIVEQVDDLSDAIIRNIASEISNAEDERSS